MRQRELQRSTWIGHVRHAAVALALIPVACGGGDAQPEETPDMGSTSVVAEGAVPELIQDGFVFTEGPVAGPDGNLYFSDIPENRIYRVLADGTVEPFLENTDGANGLAFDAQGRLIAAQGAAGQIGAFDMEGNVTVLARGTDDDPYRPNDLILDTQGGIYLPTPVSGRRLRHPRPATRESSTSHQTARPCPSPTRLDARTASRSRSTARRS